MTEVILASRAEKGLVRAPLYIIGKFKLWLALIQFAGIRGVNHHEY